MALLAASSSIACTSIRCAQAPGATHLARSAASCPPPQLLQLPASTLPSRPLSIELGGSAMAAALFASLATSDSALASQEIMSIAADDNRGLALLLPLIPAIGWVLFNILQPALNQLDRMKSAKGLAVGLGVGAASSLLIPSRAEAAAQELASLAAADNDSRGLLVLFVLAPAVGWVLFNILKPALNQLDRMKSVKGILGAAGLSAALLLASSPAADAAVQEMGSLADSMKGATVDSDARGLVLVASLVPALGWVLFNILQPAINQLDRMKTSKGIVVSLGLGAAASGVFPGRSDAIQEMSSIAAADNDSRGILLLGVLIPAIGWVLFNILQPALNQFDKMRAQK
ncbi:hypothetical protein GOP47_0026023 [Adiantum capillus-veneris]|uniref:Uncharacterized protein n=1 Tax=Adiantum capillus-veneris TaxID=13818 RepID=A0A9D4U1C1_ADICA|nr:hypothetical protein GOP47_0026023 [Adiantum capillus-veneris]